jgi:hypothetical protein
VLRPLNAGLLLLDFSFLDFGKAATFYARWPRIADMRIRDLGEIIGSEHPAPEVVLCIHSQSVTGAAVTVDSVWSLKIKIIHDLI